MIRAILTCLLLAGCGARYQIARDCQREVGPRPYQAAGVFGLAGAAWASAQPETQAYGDRVDACFAERTAAK